MDNNYHESVMVDEAVEALHIKKLANYIDATAGNGGHMLEIIKQGGRVLGIDLDREMVAITQQRLGDKAKVVQGNFIDIDQIARQNGFETVSGILFDLGVSNIHLKDFKRGFSFSNPDADLDMRINPASQAVKAADLLNVLREDQLRQMFEITMEKGAAKWITGRVLHSRMHKPITNVADMLEICQGLKTGKRNLNNATLPFLALRIAVNSELDNISQALPKAFNLLEPGGRLVVISFHSKEDRIVKSLLPGSHLILPGIKEIYQNQKSRSAKLRVIEKNEK